VNLGVADQTGCCDTRHMRCPSCGTDAESRCRGVVAQRHLKTYTGFPHGMITTQAATVNADVLEFIRCPSR